MIFDASTLPLPLRLKADLCVIGSGPGGAMAAMVAAEKGLSVVLLEAGELLTPADMVQREEVMFPLLYWEGGGRTTKDRGIHVHQGRGLGGSSLHNLNLCKRIPPQVLARWREARGLSHLPPETWDALYREVEALLAISEVPRSMWNRHNLALEAGCRELGWAGAGLAHNRTGCIGSGFCEVGCSYDAKN
ncbi:MAG TPA: GMC family oxidoreductase N-terminal domain-containing protein, partial [Polyangiaceae bacterium]|nr:GMC family oxidoreductase N-terminal domain-containing protein [Polyangiaceae bacterium]